jgi:hypothetical protein
MPKTTTETMDFIHGRTAKGRGKEGFDNARKAIDAVRGRPRKGEKSEGSRARSLRLPDATWLDLAAEAKLRKVTMHKLLRIIVAEHLYTTSWAERTAEAKKRKPRKRKAA